MSIRFQNNQGKPYEHVQRGKYLIGNREIFFRSKFEANYALYLEFLKTRGDILQWDYEPEVFVFEKILYGTRSYKPDFRVIRKDGKAEWHECKGYFDKRSRTKLKRMAIYYPKEKIIVIDKDVYKSLAKWKTLLKWY